MNLTVIGAGYVGGSAGIVFANKCSQCHVTICDKDENRISQWNSNRSPINEPHIDTYLKQQLGKNLEFTTDLDNAISKSDIIFLCVNTPTKLYGLGQNSAHDFSYLESALRQIANVSISPKIVVQKSTVPVGSAGIFIEILNSTEKKLQPLPNGLEQHTILSNPEFLAEGSAIYNLINPDRVILGSDLKSKNGIIAAETIKKLYESWIPEEKIILMSIYSAELCKIASNAFLAQRISSINSFAMICEKSGADIREVSHAIGLDLRIGKSFIQAGVGFGGSCFKKDLKSLNFGLNTAANYWQGVIDINECQVTRFVERIYYSMFQNLVNKKIVLLGYAFKAYTNDTRDSQSIEVAKMLMKEGVDLKIYDSLVSQQDIESTLQGVEGKYECVKVLDDSIVNSHALIFCTDSKDFKSLDFTKYYKIMAKPAYIFDGRIFLDHVSLEKLGFKVVSLGIS